MLTRFLVNFSIPEDFKEEEFKLKLETAYRKFGIEISNIREFKHNNQPAQEGELIDYTFETNYDFGLDKKYEPEHYDIVMNEMKRIIKRFNEENSSNLIINLLKNKKAKQ